MVTISPPNKSIDTTALANIYRGFSDGDYDECDACDWVLSNAEAILNTYDALRVLITAAEPVIKKACKACPSLATSGYAAEFEPVPPCDDCEIGTAETAVTAAKEALGT